MNSTPAGHIDPIPERDMIVTQDPTSLWLLNAETRDDFKAYEEWEKGRRFTARAIYYHPLGDVFYLKQEGDPYGIRVTDTDVPIDEVVAEDEDDEQNLAPEHPGQRHKLKPDETVWDVTRRYKMGIETILAHNEIDDWKTIKPGTWLYIPLPEKKDSGAVRYEPLPHSRPMHVAKAGGAYRYSFGNARKWLDITRNGKLEPEHRNLDIVAIAHVPIEGDTAAYYMDANAFGDYNETGLVRYNIGFNWQHLADGYYISVEKSAETAPTLHTETVIPEIAPKLTPEPIREDIQKTLEAIEPVLAAATQQAAPAPAIIEEPAPAPQPSAATLAPALSYKHSYQPLPTGKTRFVVQDHCFATEQDTGRTKSLKRYDEINIIGTFERHNEIHARIETEKRWWSVNWDLLEPHDTLYNMDKAELTWDEELIEWLAKKNKRLAVIKARFSKKKQTIER